ncbi:MAG: leucine-rich repeat domain-containing protein [Oscillospiraceae bacterium]|nr:leucine-rich repeat domain-containing protein [Oscillospiraceae bacterium]
MAPIYKKKQKRQLIVAIVCSVLVFAMLLATMIVGILHRRSLASKFEDETFAKAIADSLGLSSVYDLKQSDLDRYEGLVYFWQVGFDYTSGSSYAYPVIMLCDKEYTDALMEQSRPGYEAPEDEEAPNYKDHYTLIYYAIADPEDLNLFANLRMLRTFDTAELSDMEQGCQETQIYYMYYGMGTPVSINALLALSGMDKLTSLKQLSKLTKLEQLSLSFSGITNLEGIDQFPNLNKLDVSFTALQELTGLDSASKLTHLALNSINVTPPEPSEDEEDESSDETSEETSEESSKDEETSDDEDEDDEDEDEEEEEEEKEDPTFNETGLTAEDLAIIAKLPNLQYLDITNNNIADLSALSALQNVEYLSAGNNPLTSLSGLENMKNMEMLYLTNCLLEDASAVSGFEKLESVYLTGNKLTNLNAFSKATKVTYLDASDNLLTDASGVSGMKEILTLNLASNKLTAAPDLSGLTKVNSVNLSSNKLTDVSGLKGFDPTDYEIKEPEKEGEEPTMPTVTLNLSGNKLTEVTLKASMLSSLDLSDNKLTSLELEGCKNVKTLIISKNKKLETVPSLAKLESLVTLTASETGLTELPELKGLKKLTTVNLSKSKKIESIKGLKGNESITTLNLSECSKLSDISVLHTITALTSVDLSKCPGLNDESIEAAFGTPSGKDEEGKEIEAKLLFKEDYKLTVTLTGCLNIKNYDIFNEYSEMKVTHDNANKK